MPFQPGNDLWKLGEDTRPFQAAVKRALQQGNANRLRNIAEALLDKAAAGEAWAIKEVADRLDGKPKQQVEVQRTGELRDMSLDDLQQAIAGALAAATVVAGRGADAAGSADESGAVH